MARFILLHNFYEKGKLTFAMYDKQKKWFFTISWQRFRQNIDWYAEQGVEKGWYLWRSGVLKRLSSSSVWSAKVRDGTNKVIWTVRKSPRKSAWSATQHGSWPMKKKHKGKRYSNRNYHHLHPKSLGGNNSINNLLLIDIDKHHHWHRIFGLLTLEEVIRLLQRLQKCKQVQ